MTVTDAERHVLLADSGGYALGYSQAEAQAVVLGGDRRFGVAGPASGDLSPSLLAAAAADESAVRRLAGTRARRALAGDDPGPVLVLTPIATAQLLSRVGRVFCSGPGAVEGASALARAAGVTLVDDGALPDAPLCSLADDEGTPRQRTVLVADGVVTGALSSGTGNCSRAEWQAGSAVTTSNLYLLSHGTADSLSLAGSCVIVVDRLAGVARRAAAITDPMPLTFAGIQGRAEDGDALRVRGMVSASAAEWLGAIRQVAGRTRFFRANGVFGGSYCVADSLPGVSCRVERAH